MKAQMILSENTVYNKIADILRSKGIQKPLLVCGSSFISLPFYDVIKDSFPIQFNDFLPNPTYDSVCKGVNLFLEQNCDAVMGIGGGSAIDVAKCIKLFATLDHSVSYLTQTTIENTIPLFVMPTTAGTGSESTRFAVIYENGEKQSVQHDSILPDVVFLEPLALTTLPLYQKKCALLDALCQAIESMWSVNSTLESITLSQRAIAMVLENMEVYLDNTAIGNEKMLVAANLAGQAINLTQTTAPHAMSYKLTSLFGIPHGHAVALCLPQVWKYMHTHLDDCTDVRGKEWLEDIFQKIASSMNSETTLDAISLFEGLLAQLKLETNFPMTEMLLEQLSNSVNIDRLKNTPLLLARNAIQICYSNISSL